MSTDDRARTLRHLAQKIVDEHKVLPVNKDAVNEYISESRKHLDFIEQEVNAE